MGAKGSKGGKGPASPSSKGAAAPKLVLPPKKVKKESPVDLTYFKFLGGIVMEEFDEVPRDNANVKVLTEKLEPPKPISEMTEQEKKDWDAEVEKHEKKVAMQKLMEKNLQLKIQTGGKPIEPPVKGGIVGKAKKKIKQTQEKAVAKAQAATKQEESLDERVKKQALAGAQGSLTGGATANLGQDIAKSQQIKDLEKKRKEFAKQEELKKKQEEEARKKAEEEKKKNKPKGLADFLNTVENDKASAGATQDPNARKSTGGAARLNAFLNQVEGPAYAQDPVEVQDDEPEQDAGDEEEQPKQPQGNKLAAFLASSEQQAERPKSESKFAGFLGATVRRLSFKPAETARMDLAPENVMNTLAEDENAGEGEEGGEQEEASPEVQETRPQSNQPQDPNRLAKFLAQTQASEATNNERPKSEGKFSGFLGATVRRLTFKPADTLKVDLAPDAEQMDVVAEDDGGVDEGEEENPVNDADEEKPESNKPAAEGVSEEKRVQSNRLAQFIADSEKSEAPTERPKSEGKFAGFLGATVRRLTFKPAEGNRVDLPASPAGEEAMETLAEDETPEEAETAEKGDEPTAATETTPAAAE